MEEMTGDVIKVAIAIAIGILALFSLKMILAGIILIAIGFTIVGINEELRTLAISFLNFLWKRLTGEETQEMKEKIKSETRDDLTGLFERNKLEEIDFAKHTKISMAFLDLDNFKKINDRYGHGKGDAAIKQVASILKDLESNGYWVLRNHGARGDEFIVVFFDLGKEESRELMEKCRKKIEITNVENFKVTVSIGIASYPDDGNNKEDIIKKADEALYFSKESGRNCTTLYSEEMKKEIVTIQFRFEEVANIKNGSKILVKSWKSHNPPDISDLEAIEITDLDEDIEYTSKNKGVMTTVKTIEKEIRGVVTEVKRPSGKTLFKTLTLPLLGNNPA
jgi:diguanylate cyclase (GGDEF)-like protein